MHGKSLPLPLLATAGLVGPLHSIAGPFLLIDYSLVEKCSHVMHLFQLECETYAGRPSQGFIKMSQKKNCLHALNQAVQGTRRMREKKRSCQAASGLQLLPAGATAPKACAHSSAGRVLMEKKVVKGGALAF